MQIVTRKSHYTARHEILLQQMDNCFAVRVQDLETGDSVRFVHDGESFAEYDFSNICQFSYRFDGDDLGDIAEFCKVERKDWEEIHYCTIMAFDTNVRRAGLEPRTLTNAQVSMYMSAAKREHKQARQWAQELGFRGE